MAKKGKSSGLAVPMGGGLNEKNLKKRQAKAGGSLKLKLDEGKTKTIQFCYLPTDTDGFKEIEIHQWKEDKKTYHTVPCLGEDICPLCDDEDEDINGTRYQFVTCVYDIKEKAYKVLMAGKLAAGVIGLRFEPFVKKGREGRWTRTVFDFTKLPGNFVPPDIVRSDTEPKKLDPEKFIDPEKWVETQIRDYYGDEIPTVGSSLDDDDDDEEEYDRDDLEEMSDKKLRKVAKGLGIKLTKDGEDRSNKTLIKLILKKQG